MLDFESFYVRVAKLAKAIHEIDEDVLEAFSYEIEECYKNGFTPRRTVEVVADQLFLT